MGDKDGLITMLLSEQRITPREARLLRSEEKEVKKKYCLKDWNLNDIKDELTHDFGSKISCCMLADTVSVYKGVNIVPASIKSDLNRGIQSLSNQIYELIQNDKCTEDRPIVVETSYFNFKGYVDKTSISADAVFNIKWETSINAVNNDYEDGAYCD